MNRFNQINLLSMIFLLLQFLSSVKFLSRLILVVMNLMLVSEYTALKKRVFKNI